MGQLSSREICDRVKQKPNYRECNLIFILPKNSTKQANLLEKLRGS